MSREALFPLTLRLTALRIRSSRLGLAVAAAFPAVLAAAAVKDSYETALRIFLFVFPHVFLVAAQDMAGTERTGGGLENVIFLDGRFRRYFWQKNLAVAGMAGAYVSVLFLLLSLAGLALGRFEPASAAQFGLGLLAGAYYVGLAGALSYASPARGRACSLPASSPCCPTCPSPASSPAGVSSSPPLSACAWGSSAFSRAGWRSGNERRDHAQGRGSGQALRAGQSGQGGELLS
jgi:hypothetical protein